MQNNPILIDLPDTIETNRLYLKMPQAGYGQALHEAILDGYDDCIKWLAWPAMQPTVEAVEIDCRKHHAEFILRDCIRYIAIEKTTNRVIGRFAYPPLQSMWSIPQFGISYFVRKSARNHGYATEGAHALTLLAFRVLNAKKAEIHCDSENMASQKVPQNLGFSLEFTKTGGWPRQDEKLADVQVYSIFSENDLPALEVKW